MSRALVPEAAALRAAAESGRATFIAELATLVAIDSPTFDAEGVARVAEVVGARLGSLGAAVATPRNGPAGPTLVARIAAEAPGPRVLLVGHLDTVFDRGTARLRPLAVRDGRAHGPGAADMKGGLLLAIHALEVLRAITGRAVAAGEVVLVASPDEEVGSPSGSIAIRAEAARADVALVLEPARPGGELILERKGMLQARIHVAGRAAHAGVEPEQGRSALLAAAHAVLALHAITDPARGVTCTVGTLRGGTRPNVVPEAAVLEVDLRAPTSEAMAAGEAAMNAACATSAVDGVTMRLESMGRFAPMARTAGSEALLHLARAVGGGLGVKIDAVTTGGASDANTIAGLRVPVLDGLGPVGGAIHTPGEYLVVERIGERVALLAGLLLALGRGELTGIVRT